MTAAERMRGLVEADPLVVIEIASAIANDGEGQWPPDEVTEVAREHTRRLVEVIDAPFGAPLKARLRDTLEHMLMGRDVDAALEWLRVTGAITVLFPKLAATIDLVQETGRQHKDVWAHTKQVVR